jgi:hypothetical protein
MDMTDLMDATTSETIAGLLEDERAAVEALVGLVAMATDGLERQAMVVFGGQTAQACHELRALLERHGAAVSMRIGPGRHIILGQERYDDRLRSYSLLQQSLADRIEALMNNELDADSQAVLAPLRALHLAHHAWALTRADDFTASREAANEQARQANPHLASALPRSDSVTPLAERPPLAEPPTPEPALRVPAERSTPDAAAPRIEPRSEPAVAPDESAAPAPPSAPARTPLRLPVSKTALTAPPPPKLIQPPVAGELTAPEPAEEAPRPAPRVRRTRAPRATGSAAKGAGSPTDANQP